MPKRAIQLTWVDPNQEKPRTTYTAPGYARPTTNPDFTDKAVFTQDAVKEVVKTTARSVGTIVFGYVILDAARTILISQFGGKS
jgi:hypothetical protein